MPAKAGTHYHPAESYAFTFRSWCYELITQWIPACAGMTDANLACVLAGKLEHVFNAWLTLKGRVERCGLLHA